MKKATVFALTLWAVLAGPSHAQSPSPLTPVTITVAPGARQAFAGFGAGLGNWGGDYQKLSPAERTTLSRMLWHDLRFQIVRLWLNTDQYAPTPGAHDLSQFRRNYVDSGSLADARRQGVTTLLLAPDGMPAYLKVKRPGGPGDYALRDDSIDGYATLLADFTQRLRDEAGVTITATGVQNEPNDLDRISPEQMPLVVRALRRALDARGLQKVEIIAPENANADGALYDTLDHLKADPAAWDALAGIASHSYGMAATEEAARRIAGTQKSYWMTEASANGPEAPGDSVQAASLASRFLSDMNHRVTHWVHFLGFEVPDPHDNATRILAFTTKPLTITTFQKYFYYRQLSRAFDVGAVFRISQSSLDGDMTWTYGRKPRVTVAAARNPDGTWAFGLSNFTSPAFRDAPDFHNGFFDGYGARTFLITVRVPELARFAALPFAVRRSGPGVNDAEAGTVVMHEGQVTLSITPLELVTLRSEKRSR